VRLDGLQHFPLELPLHLLEHHDQLLHLLGVVPIADLFGVYLFGVERLLDFVDRLQVH
jgi:hypothetical protein